MLVIVKDGCWEMGVHYSIFFLYVLYKFLWENDFFFFKRETLPENKASYDRQADEKHNPYLSSLWIHAHHTCLSPRVWGGQAQVTPGSSVFLASAELGN